MSVGTKAAALLIVVLHRVLLEQLSCIIGHFVFILFWPRDRVRVEWPCCRRFQATPSSTCRCCTHTGGRRCEHSWAVAMVFASCLPIAGVLHIFANAAKDVDKALKHWDWFHGHLKHLDKLVSSTQRLQRLIPTCAWGYDVGMKYTSFALGSIRGRVYCLLFGMTAS